MKFLPRAYQRQAIAFVVSKLFAGLPGAGLFLDPGLGKTATTLAAILHLRDLGEVCQTLVIAPLRVCHNVWPVEAEQWGFPLSVAVIHGTERQKLRGLYSGADVLCINPEGLAWLAKQTLPALDMLVVDESTKFKTPRTKRFKTLRKLLPLIPRRVILTGTPSPNSLADLWAQLYILDEGATLGKTVTYFRQRFCYRGGFAGREFIVRDGASRDIEEAIRPLVLRLSAEDHLDLPPLVYNDVRVDLPPDIAQAYKQIERELFAALANGETLAASSAGAAYVLCRGIANGGAYVDDEATGARRAIHVHEAKTDAAADLVEELQGKPALIAYSFKHDRDRLLERFPGAPVLQGGMRQDEVGAILADWNAGRTRVLLAQPQSVSHGLNMQSGPGRDVIWLGLTDSLETYDQFNRRIYRQGVTSSVRVHHILANGTVDRAVLGRLKTKGDTQKSLLDALNEYRRGIA